MACPYCDSEGHRAEDCPEMRDDPEPPERDEGDDLAASERYERALWAGLDRGP